jgi:alpha-L-rhamnosidase
MNKFASSCLATLVLAPLAALHAATVTDLRCEQLYNPLGIDTPKPRLTWLIEEKSLNPKDRGQKQTAYQVLVASSADLLKKDQGDLWDSGRAASDQSIQVEYAGKSLASGAHCEWKVRVWDADGKPSAWSVPAAWTMGLLRPEDWTAQWISTEINQDLDLPVLRVLLPNPLDEPYLRRTFVLEEVPDAAVVNVNVMGFYELYVNGRKVGDDVMSPALSNYHKRSLYLTHDLKPYLRKGRNCLGLWLGRGWYWKTLDGRRNPAVTHDTAIARLQLDMTVKDRPVRIGTDAAWRCKSSGRQIIGPWSWNQMGGEQVDARREDPQWADPDRDDSDWFAVKVVPAPAITAEAQKCPPMRVLKNMPAVAATDLDPGPAGAAKYELDFGSNLTGWLKLRLRGLRAGQSVAIQYADKKNPYQTFNQGDRFISAGKAEEEFCSKFNYHGFRYAIIEGLPAAPQPADATALLIGADWETCGDFACSSPLFNRMHEINLWTLQCLSQCGFLSDCPHRERMGYGDGQVSIESCVMNFRMAPFYDKWSTDWCDGAEPNGYLPHTAPQYKSGGGGPAWGGCAQALTWRTYLYYADQRIVERNYDACRRHIEAIESHAQDGVVRAFGGKWDFIGDWVPPERGMDTHNWPPKPAAELFNNCYRLYLREQLAEMADALGRPIEAAACRAELARLRPLVHAAFYDPERQLYVLDEQSYQLLPLLSGIVPEELRATILKQLENGIRVNRKGHLDTGMLGTYFLLNYLNAIGRSDLVFTVASQTTYPGWGYMLEQGATTWLEQWNGYYSHIHSCFTSLDGWFYQGLAGIQADRTAPGFKKVIIKPAIVGDLTWVKAHFDSPYGRIVSHWRRDAHKLTMDVTIPVNTSATVFVPSKDGAGVTESGKPAAQAQGVKFLRRENGAAILAVGSGTYRFQSTITEIIN